jgi:hypothetical protein
MNLNFRKLLYIPTDIQKQKLIGDVKIIVERCGKIADIESEEQKENQLSHNNYCPKCNTGKINIVDKVRQVQGNMKVNETFYLGFGTIKTTLNIDTLEVNHCNKCGNEWKKFKTKNFNITDILKVTLNYLADIISDPQANKNRDWKYASIQVFDDCYAESVYILFKKYTNVLHEDTKEVITLDNLRKIFKSIFDK